MKKFTLGTLILLILGVTSISFSQTTPRQNVEQFLYQTGIAAQLTDIPYIINEQFSTEEYRFQPEIQAQIKSHLLASFNEELILEDAISFILNDVEQGNIQTVLDWLERPLTNRMNDLETSASEPDSQPELEAFVQRIQAGEMNESRLQTILSFDEITKTTDNTVSYIAELYLALVLAMNPYVSSDDKVDPNETGAIKEMIMREVYPQYKDVTVVLNLFTYRNVSDEDLDEYIGFYRTPEGQWFSEVSYGVFNHVLNQATLRVKEAQGFKD
jgi:hypothetical protein